MKKFQENMKKKFKKIFELLKKNEADIVLTAGIILISLASFAGGWIFGFFQSENFKKEASLIEVKKDILKSEKSESEPIFVASKNGKYYHFLWCPGAKKIKDENKIYFSSKKEAEEAGFEPAKNCPGL